MRKLDVAISMSVDGFVQGPEPTPDQPLGRGGEALHQWAFAGSDEDRKVMERGGTGVGAIICGRNTYNESLPWWGKDGPTGPRRIPVIVVTHSPDGNLPDDGVYHFAPSLQKAVETAERLAQGAAVTVMGGASVIQQVLSQKLARSIQLHIAPVILGSGLRLFDKLEGGPGVLKPDTVVATPFATHIRYFIE